MRIAAVLGAAVAGGVGDLVREGAMESAVKERGEAVAERVGEAVMTGERAGEAMAAEERGEAVAVRAREAAVAEERGEEEAIGAREIAVREVAGGAREAIAEEREEKAYTKK